MLGNNYLLWENDEFIICTPFNPHVSYSEGPVVLIKVKADMSHAWQDPKITGRAFELAAKVCRVMEQMQMAPWFNIQTNGNCGLIDSAQPFFHVYIYGRNRTDRWAKPIILPEVPKTYNNDPMPEADRLRLAASLKFELA